MAIATPESTSQVEDRIKADVQREAPDSNPYLPAHWLRSFIAGVARRIFDFYKDLNRTEKRVFPDTADDETAPIWGNIYVGEPNAETASTGNVVAQGVAASVIPLGTVLLSGENEYTSQADATISDQIITVVSITRSGATATVITNGVHNLSSSVPVTISGADQSEYNLTDTEIVVTGLDSFTFQVVGTPVTPATGSIDAAYTSGLVVVVSDDFGALTNLDLDSPLTLQQPIIGVDDTLNVDFGAIGGGSNEESTDEYKARYLDKIRNPTSHFNGNDITAKAKEVTGVTRVFVEEAGTEIGSVSVTSITRNGNVATVTTAVDHGFDDGQVTTITGAAESEYNVVDARIIKESATVFHYVVLGSPTTPATGTILSSTSIPLGQVRTFFMRDNDAVSIPSAAEVQTVKDKIDTILPANTSTLDNIVKAPVAVVVDYALTELEPNTSTMREAVENNIQQFHDEQTTVGVNVDEDAYRSAIKNTVDTITGDIVISFELSSPSGDITINSGEIATKGAVTFP